MNPPYSPTSRRDFLRAATAAATGLNPRASRSCSRPAQRASETARRSKPRGICHRVAPNPRNANFTAPLSKHSCKERSARIADPEFSRLFNNCFPNTLDTTVEPGTFEGKPDTAVLTGDIRGHVAARLLRAGLALSSARKERPPTARPARRRHSPPGSLHPDRSLRQRLHGRPQRSAASLEPEGQDRAQARSRRTQMGDRLPLLPIRLSHGYWHQTGDTGPFDKRWHDAMRLIVDTFRRPAAQARRRPLSLPAHLRHLHGDTACRRIGNPVKPIGLIASGFRPSDDACIFPFLVPSNLFAVTSLRQLAEMAHTILHDEALANKRHYTRQRGGTSPSPKRHRNHA